MIRAWRLAAPRSRSHRLALAAVLGALAGFARAVPAFAQEAAATAAPIGGSVSGYSATDWLNLVLRLGLVLVIIWFAIVAMRWWVRRMNGATGSGGGHLHVLETRSLGPNRSLQLVRLGGRAVLLGVTAEQISPVLEIDDPAEVERLAQPPAVEAGPTSFRDAVSRLGSLTSWRPTVERGRGSTPSPAAPPATARQPGQPRSEGRLPLMAMSPAPLPGASTPQPARPRSPWVTLLRRAVGLEDRPPRRVIAEMAAGPERVATPRTQATRSARAPRSFQAAAAAAGELPASRAVRARSGYLQSQIGEAQRAISSAQARFPR